jgi:hypothetical protein
MPLIDAKPIGVPVSTAIHLIGQSEHTVRRRIADGSVPLLPGHGRKRVSIAGLERYAGRPFTLHEINAAAQRALELRAAYVAERDARAARKEITP